jgi:DNA polymerase bacteriophage-type
MKVYDILNAGPRRRFTVRGSDGKPFIVSNCVQAVARDVFAESLLRLHRVGVEVVFHVHDEAVCEVAPGTDPREIERIMSITPDWLTGCPLAAEAVVTTRYCK